MDDTFRNLSFFNNALKIEREHLERRLAKTKPPKTPPQQAAPIEGSGEQEKWMREKKEKDLPSLKTGDEEEEDLYDNGACAAPLPSTPPLDDPEVEFKMEALRNALLKLCTKLTTVSPNFWQSKPYETAQVEPPPPKPNPAAARHRTVTLTSAAHSDKLLHGLNGLRRHKILCDLSLVVDDRRFHVHRSVLAAFSSYFRDLLREEAIRDNEVILEGLTAEGLEFVLNFIYTAELSLSINDVPKVLEVATALEMTAIIDICSNFLKSEINTSNCVEILNIGSYFNVTDLRAFSEDFILRNFKAVSTEDSFQQLSDRQLNEFLRSNKLDMQSELEVFEMVIRWLKYSPIRMPFSGKMMRNVRMALITPDDLVDKVQSQYFMMNDPACNALLIDAFKYHATPHRQPCMQSLNSTLRSDNEVLIAVGGLRENGATADVLGVSPHTGATFVLSQTPTRLVDHSVVTLANFMYVVGGQTSGSPGGEHSLASVYRYDPRTNSWLTLPPMQERRSNFHLCALKDKLYVVCGWKGRHERTRSVECYDPHKNTWTFVESYPVTAVAPAGAVYDDKLYIGGGYAGQYINALNMYDPDTNQWEEKASMATPRAWHSMVTVRDKIYAIGGNCKDLDGKRIDILTTECYSPKEDLWYTLPSEVPSGCSVTNAVVMKENVYIIGGYEWKTKRSKKSILCYFVEDDRWGWKSDMKNSLNGMACCTLTLPQKVPDDPRFKLGLSS
ncbi:kelch-like protein 9 isoform X2 [Ptychodera flava]|uniref:kelch-like protein 9 isoform X2 n=1 Tax=Ptychodera flava TaxID=63121 RepID=UPI00396A1798